MPEHDPKKWTRFSERSAAALSICCCDARRLLLSRMVIDHRVAVGDPFHLAETATQRKITDHLLGEHSVGMAEVGELLKVA